MESKILVPELGEGITKATVSFWYLKEGDQVKFDDDVVELVTDKATFNVSATASGKLKKIFIREGEDVSIGGVLALIA